MSDMMTSPTGGQSANTTAEVLVEGRAAAFQTNYVPTAALLLTLLSSQHSVSIVEMATSERDDSNATTQFARSFVRSELFDELLDFHERLAKSQRDLPEDAAAVLRDNLWQLYG